LLPPTGIIGFIVRHSTDFSIRRKYFSVYLQQFNNLKSLSSSCIAGYLLNNKPDNSDWRVVKYFGKNIGSVFSGVEDLEVDGIKITVINAARR